MGAGAGWVGRDPAPFEVHESLTVHGKGSVILVAMLSSNTSPEGHVPPGAAALEPGSVSGTIFGPHTVSRLLQVSPLCKVPCPCSWESPELCACGQAEMPSSGSGAMNNAAVCPCAALRPSQLNPRLPELECACQTGSSCFPCTVLYLLTLGQTSATPSPGWLREQNLASSV